MKQLVSVFFLLLLSVQLFASNVTVHYCAGKWRGMEINADTRSCTCDHGDTPLAEGFHAAPCCEYVAVDLPEDPLQMQVVSVSPQLAPLPKMTEVVYSTLEAQSNAVVTYTADPPDRKRYLLFCTFQVSPDAAH